MDLATCNKRKCQPEYQPRLHRCQRKMMLSIPSALDSLAPTTEQHETTQVEICLDGSSYSILVMSNDTKVQSVINIPQKSGRRALPWARNSVKNAVQATESAMSSTKEPSSNSRSITPSRRADSMRPRSPIPAHRSSALVDTARRREAQSCPPPRSRPIRDEDGFVARPDPIRAASTTRVGDSSHKRDVSCPPSFRGELETRATKESVMPRKSRKPNLVSMTSAKSSMILRTMRTNKRKVGVV